MREKRREGRKMRKDPTAAADAPKDKLGLTYAKGEM